MSRSSSLSCATRRRSCGSESIRSVPMTALVIAEHDNAALKSATLHTIGAAQKLGGDVHVLVAGHPADAVAKAAASIPNVAKVLRADAAYLAQPTAENVAAV